MEHVDALDAQARVPERVRRDACGARDVAGKARLLHGHVEVREQAAHVARRAGARLDERRRVDAYANRRYPSRKSSPVRAQENVAACASPRARSSSRRASASRIAAANASGALRVGADRRVAAGLVERRVRRGDDRRAGRHRLGDRHPEALEARRVDDGRGAAVEARQLVVARRGRAGRRRAGRAAAARPSPAPPTTASASSGSASSAKASTSVPRFLRGSSVATVSRYGRAEVGRRRPSGVNSAPMPGMRDDDALAREAERRGDVVGGERRVGEDHAAGARPRSRTCARASSACAAVTHSGKWSGTRSWIVVARSPARCGGYIQSREVQDVERAEPALGRRPGRAATTPCASRARREASAGAARPGSRRAPPGSRGGRQARSARTRRPRRPSRAAAAARPGQRAADVVVDARPLVRERRDVEGDPHGW